MAHYLVTAIIDFLVAIIAFSKKGNRAAKALSLTSFSLGLWSVELFLLTVIKDLDTLSLWFHITRWGMFLIPPAFALLTWIMIGGRSKLFLSLVIIPGALVSVFLSITNAFFMPSTLEPVTGGYLPKVDSIFYAFSLNFLWCLFGSVIAAGLSYRTATYREKQRVKWVLIILAMVLATGGASIYLVAYDFYLKLVGATTNITFVTLLFYATVQHHLMDLRLALSVGLARVALLTGVVWSYFFINSIIEDMNKSITGILVMLIFIVVTLELYPRALRWLLPNAKKLISGTNYDFDEVTVEARSALTNSLNVKSLNRVLDYLFKHVACVSKYEMYFLDSDGYKCVNSLNKERLSDSDALLVEYASENKGLIIVDETPVEIQEILISHEAKACFSVSDHDELLGLVLIGSCTESSYYRYDDIRLFEWLSSELGSVISRIHSLDEMQGQLGQAKKTLSMLGVMNHYHHDIKAPLAIIDGVLSNDIYDKEKQKDIVLKQVERGSRLIATMAGILKGERRRKVQAMDLTEVVKDSLYLFSQGIDDVNYLFSEIPKIKGDPEDLKILVINIVKNAIEARQEGQRLVLTVSSWISNGQVYLSFADSGTGIEEEKIGSMWEDMDTSKEGGSGIGLQAIKRIADEHDAEIEVKSTVNVGTEFIFKFPESIVCKDPDTSDEQSDNDSIFAKGKTG